MAVSVDSLQELAIHRTLANNMMKRLFARRVVVQDSHSSEAVQVVVALVQESRVSFQLTRWSMAAMTESMVK